MSNFFFQAKKKEAKKSLATTTATVSRAKAPGRNYKLLPALATNSPPDCLLNASRPQRFKVSVKLRRVAPATLFGKRVDKRLFSYCRGSRPRLSVIFFFQVLKKKQKSRWDTCDCVPGLKPRVAIINCSPLWLQTVHRTVCGARRARNALLV